MANLLQSSQTQATTAPSFFTDYLNNIAKTGQTQAGINAQGQYDPTLGAQYVGAQPLQQQAFDQVSDAASAFKPTLTAAGNTLSSAASASSPLSAASPYLQEASGDVGAAASGLMSPYMTNVVNAIGDTGQRNIMQNLAPQATSGAVGSGQFGSKRGAEVLGQTISNADRDILNQQYQAMNTGYNTALQTALAQKQLEGTLGSTAGQLTSAGTQNLINAGAQQGQLASTNQALNLADINALATLGGQQQTIAQNKELFPLTNLSTLSGLIRGYNVPTTTTTTAESSPLSALAGLTAGAAGLFTPGPNGVTPWTGLSTALGNAGNTVSGWFGNTGSTGDLTANAPVISGGNLTGPGSDYSGGTVTGADGTVLYQP